MLTYKNDDFFLDGNKINIYSGAIHYFRVHQDYWEDRLQKLKAAGFNTVETYVCWNLHEPHKGEYNFEGMLDIVRFVQTAQSVGLYAIVRPGPYICAEWDFGGLPHWLLKDPAMVVRSCYPPFLQHIGDYYKKLLALLAPLQIHKGGNIIAMQVENEYGSYGSDKQYLRYIKDLMTECGIEVLLFTSDGAERIMLTGGTLPDVLATANFGSNTRGNFKSLDDFRPDTPKMCMEFWLGWFDHWQKRHHWRPAKLVTLELKSMLKNNQNFNLYMFHGGTNFGFTNGANFHDNYAPTTTSYDYDAPLNEYGHYTPKYHEIRKLMHEHQNLPMGELPKESRTQNIGQVYLYKSTSLWDNTDKLGKKYTSAVLQSMEHYDLANGLILYEHTATAEYGGQLHLDGLGDRAYVYVNDQRKGIVYRNDKKQAIDIGKISIGDRISVLVESMGRINYGYRLHDRKGVARIRLDMHTLNHFEVTTFALDNTDGASFEKDSRRYPIILSGSFEAETDKDCFVRFDNLTKGCIFINGFNLGRYWSVPPQKTLYIPAPILKKQNTITVVEYENMKSPSVTIVDSPAFK